MPPNILFLFPDQWRWDWVGYLDRVPVRTPNLNRLADKGVVFTRAFSPAPVCAPCRACLASGRRYDRNPVPSNRYHFPTDTVRTVYRELRDSGYHVMGCGKFDLRKATFDWGLDGRAWIDAYGFSDGIDNEGKYDGTISYQQAPRGPKGPYLKALEEAGFAGAHVDDFNARGREPTLTAPCPLPDDLYCDNWVGQRGLDLLSAAPAGKPWFLQVNFTGPHNPWDIPASLANAYAGTSFPPAVGEGPHPPEAIQAVRENYSAMVTNLDRWVGRYLDVLEARGERDNTVILFSSDHGEMLGDHGLWNKARPQQASSSVPLLIAGPGVRAGVRCDAAVDILDLPATWLDWAAAPLPGDYDSRSLRPFLEQGEALPRDHVTSALGGWRMVVEGSWKLVRNDKADTACLYDLDTDCDDLHDLSTIKPGLKRDLEKRLPPIHPMLEQEA
ncbi:MAG: sulfatase family protein [Opitutales bacterium]